MRLATPPSHPLVGAVYPWNGRRTKAFVGTFSPGEFAIANPHARLSF